MPLIQRLRRALMLHLQELRWTTVLSAIAAYMLASWVLLWLAGEQELVKSHDFPYWVMVTASTVGYGDLSPVTTAGKYVVGFFVIPMGLSLFGLVVGRVAAFVAHHWRRNVNGLGKLDYEQHILVIGWDDGRTNHLLKLLLRESTTSGGEASRQVALVTRAEISNPMPDQIGFIKVKSYTNDEDMDRAGIARAACVIIDNADDDVTMTAALYCASRNPDAHIIAYFQNTNVGDLLKAHCPNIECMPSVATEMIAKSAVDPGSSFLHHELLDVDRGMTQYSARYDRDQPARVATLFQALKSQHDATLIAVRRSADEAIQINPALTDSIEPGSVVFYIADERIPRIDWEALCV